MATKKRLTDSGPLLKEKSGQKKKTSTFSGGAVDKGGSGGGSRGFGGSSNAVAEAGAATRKRYPSHMTKPAPKLTKIVKGAGQMSWKDPPKPVKP